MFQHQESIVIKTPGRGLHEITSAVRAVVHRSGITTGLCTVFLRHTSAGLVIQEDADPSARYDVERWLDRIAPDGDPSYTHTTEGPDDMAAHLRAVLTRTSEAIPVTGGNLALGEWQGLWLAEHRRRGHSRELVIHIVGA